MTPIRHSWIVLIFVCLVSSLSPPYFVLAQSYEDQYERQVEVAPTEEDIGEEYKIPVVQRPSPRSFWMESLDIALLLLAMGLGTTMGGWRVIKTLGHQMLKLQPVHGFAAETSAIAIIGGASLLGMPVSTTHVITTSIMGVGATKRLSAVRWGVAGKILMAWIITLPMCIGIAWLCYHLLAMLQLF